MENVVVKTRAEAEEVIKRLSAFISKHKAAMVADLYDLVDVRTVYEDSKWGWTDLQETRISKVSYGYLLELPKPEPID